MEQSHTENIVRIFQNGDEEMLASAATLLGPAFRLPRAGVIRPGIMKLKPGCTKEDELLYDKLVKEGLTWEEIDRKLGVDQYGRSKLIPANVDYFTVLPGDCENPESAKEIMRLYADKDGKLRSFPVWFPVNEWWNIIPHSLRCFGQSGIKFRSNFREIRTPHSVKLERVCEYPLEVVPGKRIFGGRPWGERPCDPDTCPEYQSGQCKLGGVLQFYIPGIKGAGVWLLPTTSWYSLVRIKSTLEMISGITGGRLAGILVDGKTPFVVRKIYEEVPAVDVTTGKPVRRGQWLITLEVAVDMLELARAFSREKVMARARRAQEILTAGEEPAPPVTRPEPQIPVQTTPGAKAEPQTGPEPKREAGTEEKSRDLRALKVEAVRIRDRILPRYEEFWTKVRKSFRVDSEGDLKKIIACLKIAEKAGERDVPCSLLMEWADVIIADPEEMLKNVESVIDRIQEQDIEPY
jgi:hypothetical protein